METLFPVIFLGRAAENNGGPGDRVHDMRTMWSPYDQSCNLGRPAGKKVGPEDRVLDMREMWSSYDQSSRHVPIVFLIDPRIFILAYMSYHTTAEKAR